MAVTDLPEPDSPTTASTSPAVQVEAHAVHGLDDAFLGRERDRQVLDLQEWLAGPRPRISCDELTGA